MKNLCTEARMIDSFLSIVDRLIKLKQYQSERLRRIHKELLEPTFLDLERIHVDYDKLLEEARSLLPSKEVALTLFNDNALNDELILTLRDDDAPLFLPKSEELEKVLAFIKKRRTDFEPVRVKLRALVAELETTKLPGEASNFVQAVVNYFPNGTRSPNLTWADGSITHGIAGYIEDTLQRRDEDLCFGLIKLMDDVVFFNRQNWQNVCEAFAALKVKVALEA
jgi:hypothetical protein